MTGGRILRLLAMLAAVAMTGGKTMSETSHAPQGWCLGRFYVEVPAGFAPRVLDGTILAARIEDLGPGSAHDLNRVIDARIALLEAGQPVDADGGLALFRGQEVVEGVPLLAYGEHFPNLGYTSEDWTEEAHVLSGGRIFRLSTVVSEASAPAARGDLIRTAQAIHPRADTSLPRGGVCVPGAVVDAARLSGSWSAVFMPEGVEGPVGLRLDIVERAPDQPRLEAQGRFSDPGAQPIELAGYPGQELRRVGPVVSFGAVAGATPGPDGWDVTLRAEYFDERPDAAGTEPVTVEQAGEIWQAMLSSIRVRH